MKSKMLPWQFALVISGYIVGSSLVLSFMDNLLRQDTWISIILGTLAAVPMVWCYVLLCRRFPGSSLLDINNIVFGPVIGRGVSAVYILYAMLLLTFNLRDLGDFYVGNILPVTPMAVFMVFTLLVSAYAVRKGAVPLFRVAIFALLYQIVTFLATTAMLLGRMDFGNLLPVLEAKPHALLQSAHIFAAIPIGDAFLFMLFFPAVTDQRKLGRTMFGGVGLGALVLLLMSLRNAAVLGPSTGVLLGNNYQAVRIIDIAEFLTRLEMLVALGVTFMLFVRIAMMHFSVVKGVTHILNLRCGGALILPIAGIAVVLAVIAFPSTAAHGYSGARYHPFYPLLPEMILPPVTLLVAALRRLDGRAEAKQ